MHIIPLQLTSYLVYVNYTTDTLTCVDETMVLTWHPGAVTTYALPVMEIEMIVNKLNSVAVNAAAKDAIMLNKLISNWNTVLNNYRSHNSDLTSMFSAEALQFSDVVKQFQIYQQGQLSAMDFAAAAANTIEGLAEYIQIVGFSLGLNSAFNQFVETCDQALPYDRNYYLQFSDNRDGAGPFLKAVCDDFDPDAWQSFASMINGACAGVSLDAEPNNPLTSTPLFKQLCASETLNGDSVPGGLQSSLGAETLLGYLMDNKKFVTFGANAPMQLSWTSTVSESKAFKVDFEYKTGVTGDFLVDGEFEVFGIGGLSENAFGITNQFTLHLGKSSEEVHESDRTVAVSLGDGDGGDFFAVRITEDPVYGTPVFTTMGGASKCPGETGTSRRDSNVRILEIRERCGADKASPCNELTLNPGDYASFGVVIENLSPTQDEVYYTIQLGAFFDDYEESGGDGNYTCGSPGQLAGLLATFQNSDLRRIPYNRLVEVVVSVTNNQNGAAYLCNTFNDIAVQIIATCEMPSPSSAVYQYGVEYDEASKQTVIMYDPAHRIYASNSTATFSIKWPAARRRLSDAAAPGVSQSDGSDAADAVAEILLRELREIKHSMVSKVAAMEQHKEILQSDFVTVKGLILGVVSLNVAILAGVVIWVYMRSKQV